MTKRSVKKSTKTVLVKPFTYFLPSPPQRKTGYREKEFDKILQGILQSGFTILDLKLQSSENGVFVFMILKAKNQKVMDLDIDLSLHEQFKLQDKHSSPEIELDEDNE
jgi:hypothetical protein